MRLLLVKFFYGLSTLPTMLYCRVAGIKTKGINFFCGYPYLIKHKKSLFCLGKGNRFLSKTWSNLLGLNHRCIISTSNENAELIIGNNCGFSGVTIWCFRKITIGDNVRIGANTVIMDGDAHQDDPRSGVDAPITIDDNVWLGADVKVLKGVHIGRNSLIGSGSIVVKDIPENVVAAGNPCKVVKTLSDDVVKKLVI